jgi:hypothetical protein
MVPEACRRLPFRARQRKSFGKNPPSQAVSRIEVLSGKICLIRKRGMKCGDFGSAADARPSQTQDRMKI